jgi:hypothetical protein
MPRIRRRPLLGDDSPGDSSGLSSTDLSFNTPSGARKPHLARDRDGRLRVPRLIEKKQRFRKSIEYPADSRNNKIFLGTVEEYKWLGTPPTWNTKPFSSDKKEVTWNGTVSRIDRTTDVIHPGPPYPEGDDFTKVELEYPLFSVRGSGTFNSTPSPGTSKYRYIGGFTPANFTGDFLSMSDMLNDSKWAPSTGAFIPESDVASLGTDAFLRSIPKVSYANLAEFIGEFDDVPEQFKSLGKKFAELFIQRRRRKWRKTLTLPKEVANDFIEYQFGWVPFVSDLRKFIDLIVNLRERIIKAYQQNNRWIHVRRRLTESETTSVISRGFLSNTNPSLGFVADTMQNTMVKFGNTCKCYWETQHVEKSHAWSTGTFRIYRPEFDDTDPSSFEELRKIRQLLTLFGANINPSVLWELTPWSWLIDYFTNLGDLIKTLSRIEQDSAVAREFFVMKTTESIFNFHQEFNWNTGLSSVDWPRIMRVKMRRKGDSPYHFRLNGSLSAMQLSIISAIGLQRLR